MGHGIVPPHLLLRLAELDRDDMRDASAAARRALELERPFHRLSRPAGHEAALSRVAPSSAGRTISDAGSTEDLPGTTVRTEGEEPTGDPAVDEAFDGLGATYTFFAEAYDRASVDGGGLPLLASVHYGQKYDNAFWDGSQMVFGDGDGQVFRRFTSSLSVIGHELTHGVTQFTAELDYKGQSGALNESISDVFGALVEQFAKKQDAADASWLIGVGLFTDAVQGKALRSMKAPGTAYDDDLLGKDPQPADMSGYVETDEDNGGVHMNSGIPNHAFYLAATSIGGDAWEGAGLIWYQTLNGGKLPPTASFEIFASTTVATAIELFGGGSAEHQAVSSAWSEVGVAFDDAGSS